MTLGQSGYIWSIRLYWSIRLSWSIRLYLELTSKILAVEARALLGTTVEADTCLVPVDSVPVLVLVLDKLPLASVGIGAVENICINFTHSRRHQSSVEIMIIRLLIGLRSEKPLLSLSAKCPVIETSPSEKNASMLEEPPLETRRWKHCLPMTSAQASSTTPGVVVERRCLALSVYNDWLGMQTER